MFSSLYKLGMYQTMVEDLNYIMPTLFIKAFPISLVYYFRPLSEMGPLDELVL